jgi:DNA-binding transcriptional MerR regulator
MAGVADEPRYGIAELADLGGVSRRTVRYYVQEGLLPAPRGVGRGDHYGPEHLDRLLRIKALQESGRTLDEVQNALRHNAGRSEHVEGERPPERSMWRRITVAPGVELNVAGDVRLPPPSKLIELAAWCRLHFPRLRGDDNDA